MALILDTLVFTQQLRKAGVPQDQAEAHADVTRDLVLEHVASRDELRNELSQLRSELKAFEEALVNRVTRRVTAILLGVFGLVSALFAFVANFKSLIGH